MLVYSKHSVLGSLVMMKRSQVQLRRKSGPRELYIVCFLVIQRGGELTFTLN